MSVVRRFLSTLQISSMVGFNLTSKLVKAPRQALHVGQFRTHKFSRERVERIVGIIDAAAEMKDEEELLELLKFIRANDPPYGFEFRMVMKDSDVVLFSNAAMGDALVYSFHRWGKGSLALGHQKLRYNEKEDATVFRDFLDTLWR